MGITVVTAPDDTMLTTKANVKSLLGITNTDFDDAIDQMIKEASDFITNYTGRQFAKQTVKETVRGDGLPDLLVSITPIVEVTLVEFREQEITDYVILNKASGILQRKQGWNLTNLPWKTINHHMSPYYSEDWAITYTGGFVLPNWAGNERNLPYDLERAAAEMVKTFFSNKAVDGSLKSYKIGDTAVTWNTNSGSGGMSSVPTTAMNILDYYRRAF